ncbi:MAG: hypothetical protein GTN89_13565 [Acidobacteria bacterium]|nr:hypothetical protein [Acidobacteriota bacterium]NIM60379.1 hypothetical protein [Acidobacteriota bacterium]NIO60314.1 hypothetical protein [Acidobacteriota bacterium]NIQ31369.1 hypothetical protein [Acidobacteriota bacterium]NIQ86592.1 hypothetical protein [Acidobacteriota bacterium]
MGNSLIIVGVIVVIAVVIAVVVLSRKGDKAPASVATKPEETDAWSHYLTAGESWSDHDRAAIRALRELSQDEFDRIKSSVQAVQAKALADPSPQAALRRAVMDATDRFVLVDAHQGAGPSGEAGDFASIVEVGVLRCAAHERFGDYDRDDWYAHYLNVARMNSRNVAAMVRKTVKDQPSSFESALHDPLTRTMAEVRQTLLNHPPRTSVERSDKLTSNAEARRLSPTQHQIDELTRIMSNRFEKLFAGQIYRVEAGTAADPAVTFQVDASLLYTILANNFRHSTDAWRYIMEEALGDYRGAMNDEDGLLSLAQTCHGSWEKNSEDGALNALLKTACEGAFDGAEGWEGTATGMVEDASFLSGQIQRVVRET